MRILKFALLLSTAAFTTPVLCLAQLQAVENETGRRAPTPLNDSVVSVQELKMSGKGESAFEKGTKLLLKGDARGSVAYFERTVALDPGSYRAYHNLGLAQYELGDKARAEEAFQKAIDLTSGGFAPSQFALAIILFEKRQFHQAEALIQRGLDVNPGASVGKYLLGVAQFALDRLPEAERSAHDALLRDAHQVEAHVLLARIHEREHNPYAVEADAAAYLELDPHGPLENEANALLQRARQEISQNAAAPR